MNPSEAYEKCLNKNKRITELENIIATDLKYSYMYARNVIKGQFSLGEKIISNDPGTSFHYAKFVIKKPFYLGHFTIFNSSFKDVYINFLKSIDYDMTQISEWLI